MRPTQDCVEHLAYSLLEHVRTKSCAELFVQVERDLDQQIRSLKDHWYGGFRKIDRTVGSFYDVEFVAADNRPCCNRSSTFQRAI